VRLRGGNASKIGAAKGPGLPKYLLSGLIKCVCGSAYVMVNERSYGCGGHREGACDNKELARRDRLQDVILDPIRKGMLAPERVERMAIELQREYAERARQSAERSDALPAEIVALDSRIARLRERLAAGDTDMEPDELQAAIERAEGKRRELVAAQPAAKESAKLIAMLPKAADRYRKQINLGLDGDPREAVKARVVLRKMVKKDIVLEPDGEGGLLAMSCNPPRC
jgi:hypothetical protein